MPTNSKRFSEKARQSPLAKIIDQAIETAPHTLNALDFIETPQGINTALYPIQRLIVRLMYGIPFDYRPEIPKWGTIPVWDEYHDNLLYEFKTEEECLKWMFDKQLVNVEDWRDIPKGGFREACIFAGRRGGKSEVVSAIAAYELYRLLSIRSPQEYYGLLESDIDFTFLAQDDKGASRLYRKLKKDVNKTAFFTPYVRVNSETTMGFVSESDRQKRDITPTIRVVSLPCTTNAVRGPSSRFLALDEFAHFPSKKGSTSEDIYSAAKPATANFTPPGGDNTDALVFMISSPLKKMGKMYDLFAEAMDKKLTADVPTLAMNVWTSLMNPRITSKFLHKEYSDNAITWKAEYGGKFLDSSESYVRHVQFVQCVESERRNTVHFTQKAAGREYFWGFDLGMKGDASALAIAHHEHRLGKGICLVYDYIDRMLVGEDGSWPGVVQELGDKKYSDTIKYQELPLNDIIKWLVAMNQILPCHVGATDQHGGAQLVQTLQMNGILKMQSLHISPTVNSKMFGALKGQIDSGRAIFPDEAKFAKEIGQVEAEIHGKFMLKVAAPLEKGAHDDMVDAAAVVAYLAAEYLEEHKRILLDPTGQSFAIQEQMNDPTPRVIPNLDGVSMREMQLMERMARIKKNTSFPGVEVVTNPWRRR